MQSYREKPSRIYKWSIKGVILIGSIILFSCSSGVKTTDMRPFNPEPPEIIDEDNVSSPGSLYTGYDNLFSDDKAYKVGDTITIKISENITGRGSMQSNANKDSFMNYDFPDIKFLGNGLLGKTPIAGLNMNSKDAFKSAGDTRRSANLLATITARVVKVYPNGNLFIVGKRIIKINEEMQVIKISGIVKPTYIQQDNSVESSRISDMYVEYNGKGFIADHQKPGWLYRLLVKIWPF